VIVGTLVDAAGLQSLTNGSLTILSPTPVVQPLASPSTGFTQAFSGGPVNQILYITPGATLATGTVTFPADIRTCIGQILTITTTQTITTLTVTVSGGTIYGYAAGTVGPGSVSFKKIASNVWTKI